MSTDQQRNLTAPLCHSKAINVSLIRSCRSRVTTQLKGTQEPLLSSRYFHSDSHSLTKPHTGRIHLEENSSLQSPPSTAAKNIIPELSTALSLSPTVGPSTIQRNSEAFRVSETTATFNSSTQHARTTSLSEKLASLRKAGLSPNKNGKRGTFGYARGVVESGGEGLEYCVRVFEQKYWTNMRGMKKDIEAFRKLRMEEFRRRHPLSRLEEKELERMRERFGGERVHRWAFSALKEMAAEDDDEDRPGGRPGLGALYALLEAEAFVQQVASEQAKVGADAALEADWVVGCAVESALSACAHMEIENSRARVKDNLAVMRQIAVDELVDVDPAGGAELLHVCADLEVRLAGYAEDSEQVLTTKHYAGIMETMDN